MQHAPRNRTRACCSCCLLKGAPSLMAVAMMQDFKINHNAVVEHSMRTLSGLLEEVSIGVAALCT